MFLLVAGRPAVLGPQLRGVDADVFGLEDRLGQGDELVMDDQAAQRDGREREDDDSAELIIGVDPVAPVAGSCVVLLGAGYTKAKSR